LQRLVEELRVRAYDRKIANVRCEDIMSRDVVTVDANTTLEQAWTLLHERRIKALPVVDKRFCLVGIITLADFLRVADVVAYDGFEKKLKNLVRTTRSIFAGKPQLVGLIMTRRVQVMSRERPLADLLPFFASTGHHHIPIIGNDERLVGMITQSDLVAILGRKADLA
jgi:CBS domain-containing membrane protein